MCEHGYTCTVRGCHAKMGDCESHSLNYLTSLPSQPHLPSLHLTLPSSVMPFTCKPSHLFVPRRLCTCCFFCLGCLSPLSPSRVSWAPSPFPVRPLVLCASRAFEPVSTRPSLAALWGTCSQRSTVSSPRAASWGAPPEPKQGSSVLPAVEGRPVARVHGVFPDRDRTSVCGYNAFRCMGWAR